MQHVEDRAHQNNSTIESLELTDTRSIGAQAFSACENLRAATFSSHLRVICEDAFFGCSALEDIVLPEGLVTLGERAFAKCSIRSVTLPKSLQIIGNSCFEDCENLQQIHLGQSLHTLGASAFSGCRNLRRVTLPNLTSVRDGTFAQTAVEQIVFPDKTAYIGRDAFADCKNLRLVSLPAGDLRLRGTAFAGCESLSHVIRRHKYGQEHRVFLSPPSANDITRKLSSYDKSVHSAPQALFRLSHPHALMADDRLRFESILKSGLPAARAYLFAMEDTLPREDFNKALQILSAIDPKR